MADIFSGSSNGFGNRTIISMLERPPVQHAIVGFPGLMDDGSGFNPTTIDAGKSTSHMALSNGNRTVDFNANGRGAVSVYGVTEGKHYWEIEVAATSSGSIQGKSYCLGICRLPHDPESYHQYSQANTVMFLQHDNACYICKNGSNTGSLSGDYDSADSYIFGLALDMDAETFKIYIDGTLKHTFDISDMNGTGNIYAVVCTDATGHANYIYNCNFGQSSFSHTVPTGFTSGLGPSDEPGFKTDGTNNLDISGRQIVTKARYSANISFQGSINVLVSFDSQATWNYWDGDGWVDSGGIDYTHADTIENTMAALEMSRLGTGDTYLDFAIKGVANGYGDPALSRIDIEVR